MFNPALVIMIICAYLLVLFCVALWVERGTRLKKNLSDHPMVYALSLAVYCTAWTYYGSVGKAANAGFFFLTVYLGSTMAIIFWWTLLRKMVRLKNIHKITSIADLISSRYNKSPALAAIATLLSLSVVTPYIALQLKAVIATFGIITHRPEAGHSWFYGDIGPFVACLMVLFTIVFGMRRMDPTERHQGIVMAVAVESIVKMLAFMAVGVFVTFFMFDGFQDVFQRFTASTYRSLMTIGNTPATSYTSWLSYLVLSFFAVAFLPRQFHIAVVENFRESHIRTAMWVFPLYLLLINIFVMPIAMAGLLMDLPLTQADTFVLRLPLLAEQHWLSLLVFLGGFSAAMSMVMISAMTMATMVTNHLMVPVIQKVSALRFLRRYLLQCRWAALAAGVAVSYGFARTVGESYLLVNMGIMSFAAALQFAPCIIGGLFWERGNKAGALIGLSAGFATWFYTMLIPAFVRNGWLSDTILSRGPLGLSFLAPETLFGATMIDPISNTVFWTLVVNVGGYVIGSCLFQPDDEERRIGREFVNTLDMPILHEFRGRMEPAINLPEKARIFSTILRQYFSPQQAEQSLRKCISDLGFGEQEFVTITELAELSSAVERTLAGAIGAAAAHVTMKDHVVFNDGEWKALASVYGDMLAEWQVSPAEVRKKIDYYQERENLLTVQAREMTAKLRELESEIKERIRAERALQESEEKLQAIFNQTFQFIGMLTIDGEVIEVNQTALDLIESDAAGIKGRPFWETPWWKHSPAEQQRLKDAVGSAASGEFVRFETSNQLADGSILNMDFSIKPVKSGEGKVVFLIPEGRDITERKKAEEALRDNEMRLQAILEAIPDPVAVYDSEGCALYVNPAFTGVFGWEFEDLEGRRIPFVPESQQQVTRERVNELVAGSGLVRFETQRLTKDGKVLDVFISASRIADETGESSRTVVILRDVTELKHIERQLQQSQKMEAIGTLAGGIAHDFNNILGAVMGYTELALYKTRDGIDNSRELQKVVKAGERAADLVRQILSFSRQADQERKPVKVEPVIKESLKLMRASLPTTIDIRSTIEPDVGSVLADPTQIHQVLMNLCANAAHAMGTYGGILEVRLREVDAVQIRSPSLGDLRTGTYLQLTVSDNGHGIPKDIIDRVFDPFFTTKERGEGTGMGLSVVHGIVKSHGGLINVYSEPGEGTSFHVYLPVIPSAEIVAESEPEEETLPTGSERILVVDDEETIAEIAHDMLASLGYSVTVCRSSREALDAFLEHPDAFDLVITDQTMPGMTGVQLAKEIRQQRPDMPVILCTGYSAQLSEERVRTAGIKRLIMKPFMINEMAVVIRDVLNRA